MVGWLKIPSADRTQFIAGDSINGNRLEASIPSLLLCDWKTFVICDHRSRHRIDRWLR
jgi:hypothetical protein